MKELQKRFAEFMKTGDDSAIALDLERATFTTSVKHGGRAEYEAIKKVFQKPKTPQTRVRVQRITQVFRVTNFFTADCCYVRLSKRQLKVANLRDAFRAALCSATDPTLVDETFKFVLTGAKDQDVYMFIAFLANNVATRRRMSKFFMDNYDEVSSNMFCFTSES